MGRRGESTSLHGGETTWTRVRWDQDWAETIILRPEQVVMRLGWIWDSIIVTWMDVGHYSFFLGETWPRLRWDMNVVNLMEFRRSLVESEMEIYGPGWKLEMEQGWSRDLNGDDLCGCELHIFKPWCVWYGDWMNLWIFSRPGWRWDVPWIDMRCKYMYIY